MIKIFIDTEFNEFQGELISMALVTESGYEFYEVLECKNPGPWVTEHVMPILEKEPVTKEVFVEKLQYFLSHYDSISIIADWPDDIRYFCESLITGPGMAISHPPITFILDRTLSSGDSKVPHNALHDARAIAEEYMKRYEQTV
jgi:hypothetical protein